MRLEVLLDGLPKRLDLARDAAAKHEAVHLLKPGDKIGEEVPTG